jgi:pantetheine-phosphate adenylyltransferase
MKNKIALIVGRFQPFHKGHLFLIKKAINMAEKVIIGIGSANIIDVNNPIDFETRKKIIKAVFYKEGIEQKLLKIVPLDDFFDDQKWFFNLKKQVGEFDLALGNNQWTNNILKKAGHKVLKVDYYNREKFEGWRIRRLIKEGKRWQDRVPKYLINFVSNYPLQSTNYNFVIVGGTFDHFHIGHQALLNKALEIGKKVTIGIATEEIYKNKFLSQTIQSYSDRYKIVKKFIKNKGEIISFSEFTGGMDKRPEVDAIVVSRETFPNALKINELRKNNKLRPMTIVIVEDVLAEDGKIISSERIRVGEIDRKGNVMGYELGVRRKRKELIMKEELRPELQKPLGKVFDLVHKVIKFIKFIKPVQLITVGDIITDSLLKEGVEPDVKVIDNRSRREDYIRYSPFLNLTKNGQRLINKPGTINLKTAEKLKELILIKLKKLPPTNYSLRTYGWLVINGEEDLLTLPAILFAPLNSLILYGHWQHGIIAVEVDEEIKGKVRELIKRFI